MIYSLFLMGSLGCLVGKAKYEDTLAELNATQVALTDSQAALDETQRALSSTREALGQRNQDVQSLRDSLDGANAQMTNLQHEQDQLQDTMSKQQLALQELEKRRALTDGRIKEYHDLLSRFRRLIDAGRLKVKIVDGRMVVELATDILFASGSADLSEGGKESLAEVAGLLSSIPERTFQIEGHTDDVPIRTEQYPSNWELAAARALTVIHSLVESGLAPERVSAASFSEYRPVVENTSAEGRSTNRRIEIVVLPDLSTLPGFDELNQLSTVPPRPKLRDPASSGPARIQPKKRGQ